MAKTAWLVTSDLQDALEKATEAETLKVFNVLYALGGEDGDLTRELALWIEEIACIKGDEEYTASVERLRTGS